MRLVKYLAERGCGSRRKLDRYIQTQGVIFNGERVFDPAMPVTPEDRVEMDNRVVSAAKPERCVFLLYKPRGVLTTHDDPQGRPCVGDLIKDPSLKTIGRLDQDSEGLLILTNDGAFKRSLELPQNGVQRTYRVHYDGVLNPDCIARAATGLTLGKVHYRPCSIQKVRPKRSRQGVCEVQIFEGKNREVRKIMGSLGCTVTRLVRISYGPFTFGLLMPGQMCRISHT